MLPAVIGGIKLARERCGEGGGGGTAPQTE